MSPQAFTVFTTFTAQMAQRGGRWCVYVVLPGVAVARWPEYDLGSDVVVPSVQQRSRAVHALGYVCTDGAVWRWDETSPRPYNPDAPAQLFASIEVREASR